MQVKKSDEVLRLEEALKRARQKQKDDIKKSNSEFTEIILKPLMTNNFFKKDLREVLEKYKLNNAIDLLQKNYNAFDEIKVIERDEKEKISKE